MQGEACLHGAENEDLLSHVQERSPIRLSSLKAICFPEPLMPESGEFMIRPATDRDAKAVAAAALYRFNVETTGIDDRAPIGAELCDNSGAVVGGLWGRTELGILFLDMFFLPEHLRGRSYGTMLLKLVEGEARRRDAADP